MQSPQIKGGKSFDTICLGLIVFTRQKKIILTELCRPFKANAGYDDIFVTLM